MDLDSDRDGILDYLEHIIGTDPFNTDTDEDGLADGYEIKKTQTDPLLTDSDENGVLDGDEDFDGDDLTNLEEYSAGTYPNFIDTDGDGLSDYEEVRIYGTNPLEVDTDDDGITDWEEVQLGLDPKNPMTDGIIPDALRTFNQTLDDTAISETLTGDDQWLIPSISGNVAGVISEHLSIVQSDIDTFNDNRALLSTVIDVVTTYNTPLMLTFDYSDSPLNYDGDLNNLSIFKFDEDDLSLVDTTVDAMSKNLSGEILGEGTYFVMDLNEFLKSLGIDIFKNVVEPTSHFSTSLESNEETIEPKLETIQLIDNYGNPIGEIPNPMFDLNFESFDISTFTDSSGTMGKADIVFVIDTTGSMGSAINNVRNNVNVFADRLVNEYNIDANFALVEYRDIAEDGLYSTRIRNSGVSNWFTDVTRFQSEISSLTAGGGGDTPETPIDGLEMARRLNFRSNANKFVVLITDANYKTDNRYGITSMTEMSNLFMDDSVVVSVVSYNEDIYGKLFRNTSGLYGNIFGNFSSILIGLADKIGGVTNEGEWLLLDDYQAIRLSAPLAEGSDTDGDSLADHEELNRSYEKDITLFIQALLAINSVPRDLYIGETSINVWSYFSNPVLQDTDFDGMNDKGDLNPKNNQFKGTLHAYSKSGYGQVEFNVDYRIFFNNNDVYNPQLSVLSSLYATDIYGDDKGKDDSYLQITNGISRAGDNTVGLLQTFGMTANTKTYHISNSRVDIDDKTQFSIGHRLVEYRGIKQEIIAVVIRGTNGTIEEWSSNFDIGAATNDYYNITGRGHHSNINTSEWKNRDNHKGFDVASNRVIEQINRYLNEEANLDSGAQKVIWIMGHSRGAAIANIVGAYFEDRSDFRSFTYAFATPNSTTSSSAQNYRTIFNIINRDDFVAEVAPATWGYTKFGRTYSESISAKYEDKFGGYDSGTWEYLVGFDYDNYGGLSSLVSALSAIISNRENLYKYTCSCHGDNTLDNITIRNRGMSKNSREDAIAKIPSRAQNYANITRYDGWGPAGWDFEVCQTPAYFMQLIASTMGGEISSVRFAVELNIADRYEKAKSELKKASGAILGYIPAGLITNFGGLEHPHYPETYYLLATKFTANNFK